MHLIYNNLTENLLLGYTLAPSVGFRTMTTNMGAREKSVDLQNKWIDY